MEAENWDLEDNNITFSFFENDNLIVCISCLKKFKCMQGLQHHKKIMHNIRDIFCEICYWEKMEKIFFHSQGAYKQHKLSHK